MNKNKIWSWLGLTCWIVSVVIAVVVPRLETNYNVLICFFGIVLCFAGIGCFNVADKNAKVTDSIKDIIESKRVASFEKISFDLFKEYYIKNNLEVAEDVIKLIYCKWVSLPVRATKGSAGYDFISPLEFTLKPGESIVIPTGIRCKMLENWVLMVFPRSGLGFKYRAQLANTVGIIDSDYYYSDNEGHIMIKLTNDSKDGKELQIKAGDRVCQGIFLEYGITEGDDAQGIRNGGFGSTNK